MRGLQLLLLGEELVSGLKHLGPLLRLENKEKIEVSSWSNTGNYMDYQTNNQPSGPAQPSKPPGSLAVQVGDQRVLWAGAVVGEA